MDTNTYVLAVVLNGLQQKELGLLPPEAEFTAFILSVLRQTPKRDPQRQEGHATHAQYPSHVEATA